MQYVETIMSESKSPGWMRFAQIGLGIIDCDIIDNDIGLSSRVSGNNCISCRCCPFNSWN